MNEGQATVILIDDEEDVLLSSQQTLELEGLTVLPFRAAEPALDHVSPDWPGVILTDVKMPLMDGMELLRRVKEVDSELPVILVTGHGDVPMALQAVRNGAYDFIEKPAPPEYLVDAVGRALATRRLVLENRALRRELATFSGMDGRIVGCSDGIERVRNTIANIADTGVDVLISGETGTGKELVARCLHEFSNRQDKEFVALNCGALPETIIESELFGHEAGAFTGAAKRRIGKIEFADGGTLFLDEIESMPFSLQVKLLRVLQERSVERLGGNKTIPVDVRVIAATKVDLVDASGRGEFREDLFYRLNVANIFVPPLRDRSADIPLLFQHFLQRACIKFGRALPDTPPDRMEELMARPWPGNVRELGNFAERYVLGLNDGDGQTASSAATSLPERVEAFERQIIEEALRRNGAQVSQTATQLGIPRKKLYLRMQKYGLSRRDFIPS
ncbi:MAG: sigma-54-dependent Fis family transcriptional regulator [Alphaproteobacteria bacterium]|nr:sigma-54-dependent Fis family transcriptional regulator [Alphaproteobacteria bacterium]